MLVNFSIPCFCRLSRYPFIFLFVLLSIFFNFLETWAALTYVLTFKNKKKQNKSLVRSSRRCMPFVEGISSFFSSQLFIVPLALTYIFSGKLSQMFFWAAISRRYILELRLSKNTDETSPMAPFGAKYPRLWNWFSVVYLPEMWKPVKYYIPSYINLHFSVYFNIYMDRYTHLGCWQVFVYLWLNNIKRGFFFLFNIYLYVSIFELLFLLRVFFQHVFFSYKRLLRPYLLTSIECVFLQM